MTAAALTIADSDQPQPVAPYWHTTILVAVIGLMALLGNHWQSAGGPSSTSPASRMSLYLSLLAMEWGLFSFVRKGIRLSGTPLAEAIGPGALCARGLLTDLLLGLACWGALHGIESGWLHLWGAGHSTSVQALLPRQPLEITLWVAVSISAGICEELAFRGYCQRQFSALTRSPWLGVLLQALVFGLGHAYEGWSACLRIVLYGILFGLLAQWRRQLRAGMIGHACADILAGLFGI